MNQLALNLGDYIIDENFSNFPGLENKRGSWLFGTGKTPTQIIEAILPFVFVIAGLILFVMFIFGGFTIFTSAISGILFILFSVFLLRFIGVDILGILKL